MKEQTKIKQQRRILITDDRNTITLHGTRKP